jgi:hypothetical protein
MQPCCKPGLHNTIDTCLHTVHFLTNKDGPVWCGPLSHHYFLCSNVGAAKLGGENFLNPNPNQSGS